MSDNGWFAAVGIVHRLPGRIRLRYRCQPGTPAGGAALEATLAAALAELPGVRSVRVNAKAASVVLAFDAALTGAEVLRDAMAALPVPASVVTKPAGSGGPDRTAVAASLATLVGTGLLPAGLQFPVTFGAALPVLKQGVADFRENGLTSHVLEGLAVAISLARGDYGAANTTTFLLALGEYLEDSIARRSDELLKNLLRPGSDEVWVLKDGAELLVKADKVAVGDHVVVGAGAAVPVDGTVLSGDATVNEAAMTGESLPVAKARGATVLSGTLVEEGRLVVYAEQVGARTAASRIADYVELSLAAKSKVQLEASSMADRLVPGVLKLGGAAYLLSGDWSRAASVLQADYSCALKLATPVAFKSAMYEAGRAGILVKGANALERLAEADTFIFDKTGTLTTGSLEVTDVFTFDESFSADDLICLAASVEEHYFHPLAQAVVAAARATHNRHFDHQEVQFIVAHGVASMVEGKRIVVGSRHFVEEDESIDIGDQADLVERLYAEGKTLLFIGFGGRLLGILALKDSVRANSLKTIGRLRRLGAKRILLLTGDHRDRGAELAEQLGLDGFHAELLPEDKVRIVRELSEQGARIAFIGDGINDAPALAGAHVGIAMQKGADIARLTADVALLEDDIERVADAKELANSAMKVIGTNYRLTVRLNTAILSAAALGLLSPVTAAVLHNGATVGILLNALRRRKQGGKRR